MIDKFGRALKQVDQCKCGGLALDEDGNYTAAKRRLVDLANPLEDSDAVTYEYVNDVVVERLKKAFSDVRFLTGVRERINSELENSVRSLTKDVQKMQTDTDVFKKQCETEMKVLAVTPREADKQHEKELQGLRAELEKIRTDDLGKNLDNIKSNVSQVEREMKTKMTELVDATKKDCTKSVQKIETRLTKLDDSIKKEVTSVRGTLKADLDTFKRDFATKKDLGSLRKDHQDKATTLEKKSVDLNDTLQRAIKTATQDCNGKLAELKPKVGAIEKIERDISAVTDELKKTRKELSETTDRGKASADKLEALDVRDTQTVREIKTALEQIQQDATALQLDLNNAKKELSDLNAREKATDERDSKLSLQFQTAIEKLQRDVLSVKVDLNNARKDLADTIARGKASDEKLVALDERETKSSLQFKTAIEKLQRDVLSVKVDLNNARKDLSDTTARGKASDEKLVALDERETKSALQSKTAIEKLQRDVMSVKVDLNNSRAEFSKHASDATQKLHATTTHIDDVKKSLTTLQTDLATARTSLTDLTENELPAVKKQIEQTRANTETLRSQSEELGRELKRKHETDLQRLFWEHSNDLRFFALKIRKLSKPDEDGEPSPWKLSEEDLRTNSDYTWEDVFKLRTS